MSACLAAFSAPALAASATTPSYDFDVTYDIYAGGMHLIDVTQQFHLGTTSYSSTLTAKPTGFFSRIVPWEGRYSTNGRVVKNRLIPQLHTKTSRWGDERDETVMKFNANGQLISMTERDWINGKARPAPHDVTPDPTLSRNALDLVTAVLHMLQNAQLAGLNRKEACSSTDTVFDGKRRFAMQFSPLGMDKLDPSRYTPFKGTAPHCEIEIKPLAGFNGKKRGFYKIQEDSRAQGELPSLWLMPAWHAADAPPIPVRMKIKSQYGAIFVHAAKVTRR